MDLNLANEISAPVTVWHFLAEDEGGGAVWHPVLYDAAVVRAERVSEVRMTRHGVAELQGFLFPTEHLIPVTPSVGHDCIAPGDFTFCESPASAQRSGAEVYCFHEVIRPPRLRCGTMVEWVQFTVTAIV
ncbi:MAG: hypothetical protein E7604_01635 [Ruminococcaceae bacterium]|nr:hypothetical protein [Oscillospiraceae bacterium]